MENVQVFFEALDHDFQKIDRFLEKLSLEGKITDLDEDEQERVRMAEKNRQRQYQLIQNRIPKIKEACFNFNKFISKWNNSILHLHMFKPPQLDKVDKCMLAQKENFEKMDKKEPNGELQNTIKYFKLFGNACKGGICKEKDMIFD
jgi:hypothetical protein